MAHGTQFTESELEQLADEFDRGEYEIVPGTTQVIETDTSDRTATMSVRMPLSMIAALKAAAEDEGVGATVLARQWIAERLAQSAPVDCVVSVAEVMSFVAEHSRRVS